MNLAQYQVHLPDFELKNEVIDDDGEVFEGTLIKKNDSVSFPIVNYIPRFVPQSNYADNFGLQWNKFKNTQLDSYTKKPLSFNRFWNDTKWKPKDIYGKKVLEVGSGAGRFSEILLEAGAILTTLDYSSAVEANYSNNKGNGDFFIFQGNMYELPVPDEYYDYVFCFGVLQHTPDPDAAYNSIFKKLKPGGEISIDFYVKEKFPSPWSTPKYLWRPITTKMDPIKLLKIIEFYIPLWLPFDSLIKKTLYRIPKFGYYIAGLIPIPCWNYFELGLDKETIKIWAVMDTFDAMGAQYDTPRTEQEVEQMVGSRDNEYVKVGRGGNGVVANVKKKSIII